MLDISSSIQGESNFQMCLTFVKSVFGYFSSNFESKTVRFGLVSFSTSATVVFSFGQYSSFSEVEGAVMGLKLASGGCAAGAALSTCQSSLFAAGSSGGSTGGAAAGAGASAGASGTSGGASAQLLVVLMAGKSTDDVSASAGALKTMGVSSTLNRLTSTKNYEHVTNESYFIYSFIAMSRFCCFFS